MSSRRRLRPSKKRYPVNLRGHAHEVNRDSRGRFTHWIPSRKARPTYVVKAVPARGVPARPRKIRGHGVYPAKATAEPVPETRRIHVHVERQVELPVRAAASRSMVSVYGSKHGEARRWLIVKGSATGQEWQGAVGVAKDHPPIKRMNNRPVYARELDDPDLYDGRWDRYEAEVESA